MISSANITVRSFEYNWLDIFWEFSDSDYDERDHEWRVVRSESAAGPWSALTGWIQGVHYLRDNITSMISRTRTLYYCVEVRAITNPSEVNRLGPGSLRAAPGLVGMELIRQVRMELMYSGRMAFLVPIRTIGMPCISCVDMESGTKFRSRCEDCFDTERAGGYLSPIRTEIDVAEVDSDTRSTDTAKLTQNNTSGRMSNFPPAKQGDIVVTSENKRFRVEKVVTTEHRASPFEQNIILHEIPRGDVEYKIPIDVGDLTRYDTEVDTRVLTNPTSDDVLSDDDVRELLGMFGGVKLI